MGSELSASVVGVNGTLQYMTFWNIVWVMKFVINFSLFSNKVITKQNKGCPQHSMVRLFL